jgi:alkanesulfonate monooxygenase SsuD/methylene tetrahydromethanopterin reductase-like flavin-dependent oxidoreductase (luciferase family)
LKKIALALRSELYKPEEILEFAKSADSSKNISHIFFPDIPNAQESIELCSVTLATTKQIKIGSGVLRLSEHDPIIFSRRIATIQWVSDNRFVLGIGTGSPGINPNQTIQEMFSILEEIKKRFPGKFNDQPITIPDVLVASLGSGIAIKSIGHADGLILNFCSPAYSEKLLSRVKNAGGKMKTIVCYVKIFYSEKDSTAERLLAEEFVKYDRLPQYHAMFEKDGVAEQIASMRNGLSKEYLVIPNSLKRICLANPSSGELSEMIERFRSSGVNVPCVYPYFRFNESTEFKKRTIEEITGVALD